jgi:hypothetical protein
VRNGTDPSVSETASRLRRWEDNLRAVGGLGMAVFFGALLLNDDVDRSPAWVMWPAFALTQIGVIGSLLIHLHRRRTVRRPTEDRAP